MAEYDEHLNNLSEIRTLMEKSSRFLSLSGLSGISAGIVALIGAVVAYFYLGQTLYLPDTVNYIFNEDASIRHQFLWFLIADGACVFLLAIGFGLYFTMRRAKKNIFTLWDPAAKRLLINLFIPLIAGGLFCLSLLYHYQVFLVAPATLVFYGLGLLNASRYTLNDIRYLGLSEIALGIISSFYIYYGLLFWALGFGVLHIVYGALMYYKYER